MYKTGKFYFFQIKGSISHSSLRYCCHSLSFYSWRSFPATALQTKTENEMRCRKEGKGRRGQVTFARLVSFLFSCLSSLWACPCPIAFAILATCFLVCLNTQYPSLFLSASGYVYGSAYASPSLFSARCVLVSVATDDII